MITHSTTLVLGAGASAPYGYPVGSELRQMIINGLNSLDLARELNMLSRELSPLDIEKFKTDLTKSGTTSIDEFLEYQKPEYGRLGKLAIAQAIVSCELEVKLDSPDWYDQLVRALVTSPDMFYKNRLSIITFNYDRSLEHALYIKLQSRFSIDSAKTKELVECIPIVHVHGHLGHLPWQMANSRDYSQKYNLAQLECMANGIRIVHEDQKLNDEAFNMLQNSERVYFLGFSYNQSNLKKIGFDQLNGGRNMMGTALGMSPKSIQSAKNACNSRIDFRECNVGEFFRNYGDLN